MHRAHIQGVTGRPRWRRTRPDLLGKDLVDRQSSRSGPNQLWVTDITEHHTREGKLYCAVVLDAYSRRVVGWSIDASPNAAPVTDALGMAIDSRRPPAGAIIHSDQGVQFGSWAFTGRAKASRVSGHAGAVHPISGVVTWGRRGRRMARRIGLASDVVVVCVEAPGVADSGVEGGLGVGLAGEVGAVAIGLGVRDAGKGERGARRPDDGTRRWRRTSSPWSRGERD